jgi:hypothetical protein
LSGAAFTWRVGNWMWDERFECALSTFDKDSSIKARDAAAAVLTTSWTSKTMAGAPAPIRQLSAETGGIRSVQLLFTAEASPGVFAYCLWWPWENGANYSARLGALGVGRSGEVETILRSALAIK